MAFALVYGFVLNDVGAAIAFGVFVAGFVFQTWLVWWYVPRKRNEARNA